MTEVALVDENWKPSSGDLNESKAKNHRWFVSWFFEVAQFDKNDP